MAPIDLAGHRTARRAPPHRPVRAMHSHRPARSHSKVRHGSGRGDDARASRHRRQTRLAAGPQAPPGPSTLPAPTASCSQKPAASEPGPIDRRRLRMQEARGSGVEGRGGVRKKIRAPKRWLGRRIGGAAAFFLHIRDFVCPRGEAKLPLLVGRDIRLPIADWRLGTKPMDGAGRSRRRGGDGFRESWGRGRIARGTQSQRCEVRRKRPLRGEEATYFGRGSCSRRRVLRTAPKCLRRPAGDPAKCTL